MKRRGEFRKILEVNFRLSKEEADAAVELVRTSAEVVEPQGRLAVITAKDDDNRIPECAVAAKADFLVTGDKKHVRKLETYGGIEILLPAEFHIILRERNLLP